jgi:hypothetical protein
MTMSDRPLPGWPRGLREELAAAYIGVSPSLLRREVAADRAPHPVQVTAGRLVYLREDLDAYLDRLAGRPEASGSRTPELDAVSEWDAAFGGTGGSALP